LKVFADLDLTFFILTLATSRRNETRMTNLLQENKEIENPRTTKKQIIKMYLAKLI